MRRPAFLPPGDDAPFPPVELALIEPNGLLAVGGDLSVTRLMRAYRAGIFPWFEPGQAILWWSPDPRTLLSPERLRIDRSLAKRLRNGGFRLTADRAFAAVLAGCAAPRRDGAGTWLGAAMRAAYSNLHLAGHAHSIEVWQGDALVGGLYGVAVGGVFCGESMWSRVPDASKVALATFVPWWQRQGGVVIDCQLASPHLTRLGASPVPRADFLALLARHRDDPLEPAWRAFPADT